MKILHVISSVNPAGGGPIEGVLQLGTVMGSFGNQIEIASMDSPDAPYLNRISIPVHALGPSQLGFAFSRRFIPWLRANRGRYDSVVVNGIWQFQSIGAWHALRNSSTPYFLFTHGMLDPWFTIPDPPTAMTVIARVAEPLPFDRPDIPHEDEVTR